MMAPPAIIYIEFLCTDGPNCKLGLYKLYNCNNYNNNVIFSALEF